MAQPQRRYLLIYLYYSVGWLFLALIWRLLLPNDFCANALIVGTLPIFLVPSIVGLKACWSIPKALQKGDRHFGKKPGEPKVTIVELLEGIAISIAFLIWIVCLFFWAKTGLTPINKYLFSIVGLLFTCAATYFIRTLWFGWRNQSLCTAFGNINRKLRPGTYWFSMGFFASLTLILIAFATVSFAVLLTSIST